MPVPDGDDARLVERITHTRLKGNVQKRTSADRVDHDGCSHLVREEHLAQVHVCVGVVQDASASENEEIEAGDDLLGLLTGEFPGLENVLDLVAAPSVLGVSREDGDFEGKGTAKAGEDGVKNRLIAEVEPPVRTRDADLQLSITVHGNSLVPGSFGASRHRLSHPPGLM